MFVSITFKMLSLLGCKFSNIKQHHGYHGVASGLSAGLQFLFFKETITGQEIIQHINTCKQRDEKIFIISESAVTELPKVLLGKLVYIWYSFE